MRIVILACLFLGTLGPAALNHRPEPNRHLVYTRSRRATFTQLWKYTFPHHRSTEWVIALRDPPELPWSRHVVAKAELLTSAGWKRLHEATEVGGEHRHMLVIDDVHDDPLLRNGFTVRATLTATMFDQRLVKGRTAKPVPSLDPEQREEWLAATQTYDFNTPFVKEWMDHHKMWKGGSEDTLHFVHRVYKQFRVQMPYRLDENDRWWTASQILKGGSGECRQHAIVSTAILRANRIPARTICGAWAFANTS